MNDIEKHKQRHLELHKALDQLVADYMDNTHNLPSNIKLTDLMSWSFEQTKNPVGKWK